MWKKKKAKADYKAIWNDIKPTLGENIYVYAFLDEMLLRYIWKKLPVFVYQW